MANNYALYKKAIAHNQGGEWTEADQQEMTIQMRDNTFYPNMDVVDGKTVPYWDNPNRKEYIEPKATTQTAVNNNTNNMQTIAQARSGQTSPTSVSSSASYSQPLTASYNALSQEQKLQAGDISQFSTLVQQQTAKGINEDVAIGSAIMGLGKKTATPSVISSSDAKTKVDSAYREVTSPTSISTAQPTTLPLVEDYDIQQVNAQLDSEYSYAFGILDAQRAGMDDRMNASIDSIQQKYDSLRAQTAQYNANRLKALEIMGGRAGRQRFAQEIQSGILSAETSAGLERISALNKAEQEERMGVIQAYEDKDYQLMMTRFDLMKNLRQEKTAEVDKLYQRAMQEEELLISKQASARADAQFLLEYEKFNEAKEQNDWDKAYAVAKESGQRMVLDANGDIELLPELTFENQLKYDTFALDYERTMNDIDISQERLGLSREEFALNKVIQEANLELNKKGLVLDEAKFKQNVAEFGMDYAIKQANLSLSQQSAVMERYKLGLPTTYDQIGVNAPDSDIALEVGNVIDAIDTSIIGEAGSIRKDGWECGEFAGTVVDLGTTDGRMGNTLEQKINSVNQFGLTAEEVMQKGGYAIGDVLITNGSDVSGNGGATAFGHAAVVSGFDEAGNLILKEANRKGDGKITSGRVLSTNSPAIVGILGRQNEKSVGAVGLKDQFMNKAKEMAGKNIIQTVNNTITKETSDVILSIKNQIKTHPAYTKILEVKNGYQSVLVGLSEDDSAGFGDLAAINGFQRMVDPGAVVREGEFKTVAEAQGFLQAKLNIPAYMISGDKLTPEGREQLKNVADSLYKEKVDDFNSTVLPTYKNLATDMNIDFDRYIGGEILMDTDDKYNPSTSSYFSDNVIIK